MRSIFLLLVTSLLLGCSGYPNEKQQDIAKEICKDRQGVLRVEVWERGSSVEIVCKDNTHISMWNNYKKMDQ